MLSTPPEFTATFRYEVVLFINAVEWIVVAPTGIDDDREAVETTVADCLKNGWIAVPGWEVNLSPGYDPEWQYLRLIGIGAVEVTGPFPQVSETLAPADPRTIVG